MHAKGLQGGGQVFVAYYGQREEAVNDTEDLEQDPSSFYFMVDGVGWCPWAMNVTNADSAWSTKKSSTESKNADILQAHFKSF